MSTNQPATMEWSEEKKLVAVTLNIGGRNTNPLEFILDGDSAILLFCIDGREMSCTVDDFRIAMLAAAIE